MWACQQSPYISSSGIRSTEIERVLLSDHMLYLQATTAGLTTDVQCKMWHKTSAARKIDTKVAKLLPKIPQKVATLKILFETTLAQKVAQPH